MKIRNEIQSVAMKNIDITSGFWFEKQKLIRNVTMQNVYKRFYETGRFDAFGFTWKEGDPNKPHIFWDSDVAKWIEAVGYLCMKHREPEMEKIVDEVVDRIEKNRFPDGYFNSYFGHLEPENRFTRQHDHELYCAGHLLEAAIAYKEGTGKDRFYRMMKDYMDLIYRVFYQEKSAAFDVPGHEEIELALVKLYRHSGEKKYLDLAQYFVEKRGTTHGDAQVQNHLPIREQKDAQGHAVRAGYFFSAAADVAKDTRDEALADTVRDLFYNIVDRRMYVTGAVGQSRNGEAFGGDYDLPNAQAYAETCANLSLAFFARRMSLLEPNGIYADTVERVLYNAFLSGLSLDGKAFFYSNMQENAMLRRKIQKEWFPDTQRVEVFSCSCCPPNVVRAIASVADFAYTTDGDTVWCHQYFGSEADFGGRTLRMTTEYPYDGTVRLECKGKPGRLALRIPGWCNAYTCTVNGEPRNEKPENGYLYLPLSGQDDVLLKLEMPVREVEARPEVWEDDGRICVTRGPLVYGMEGIDNEGPSLHDIRLPEASAFRIETDEQLKVPVLTAPAKRRVWHSERLYDTASSLEDCSVRMIPYFAFANRGETDLVLWSLKQ